MIDKKSKDHLLERRIDEILYFIWDPIGIMDGGPDARDEYVGYVDHVFRVVSRGDTTREQLTQLLDNIITQDIGLDSRDDQKSEKAAELILAWHSYLADR